MTNEFTGWVRTELAARLAPRRDDRAVSVLGAGNDDLEAGRGYLGFSLRSRGDFRCDRFARSFGGGGHHRAAGFRIGVSAGTWGPMPWEMLRWCLDHHLVAAANAGAEP